MRILQVTILGLLAFSAAAQTNYVTNWVNAPTNYRVVSNQVYDVNTSTKWTTISIPPGSVLDVIPRPDARHYPAPGQRIQMTAKSGKVHQLILNFPYDPADMPLDTKTLTYRASQKPFRVFYAGSTTNWGPNGVPESITRTYDYGLPCTNKIPVVSIRK